MRPRIAIGAAIAVLGLGCDPPRCPSVRVTLPATEAVVPWLEPVRPLVTVRASSFDQVALLDTGFPRSASPVGERIQPVASFELGGATTELIDLEFSSSLIGSGIDVVVGADVLSQLPLVFDARAATTRIEREFTPAPATGAAPLWRWSTGLCRGDDPRQGREGPDLLLVEADLDGRPLVLAVDTGADLTLVRQSALPDLSSRPTLSGLPLHTAFAGDLLATATRARALSIGGQSSAMAPVLTAPQIDQGLDGLLQQFRDPPPRLDGALGRSFLREFEVSLALGDGAATGRALGLTRFDTQAHWSRDFVGVGIATTRSASPAGLRIGALLSTSPARDAGLQVDDVIVTVNGAPALAAPTPWGQPGEVVQLGCARGGTTFTAAVPIADLLPDP